jgi:hypothetical protein
MSKRGIYYALKRRLFPVIPTFVVTIKKQLAWTFELVTTWPKQPAVSHATKMCFSMSCARDGNNFFFIKQAVCQGPVSKEGSILNYPYLFHD